MVVMNLLMVVMMEDGRSDPKLVGVTGSTERLFSIPLVPRHRDHLPEMAEMPLASRMASRSWRPHKVITVHITSKFALSVDRCTVPLTLHS